MPSTRPECRFPEEYRRDWYLWEKDRQETVRRRKSLLYNIRGVCLQSKTLCSKSIQTTVILQKWLVNKVFYSIHIWTSSFQSRFWYSIPDVVIPSWNKLFTPQCLMTVVFPLWLNFCFLSVSLMYIFCVGLMENPHSIKAIISHLGNNKMHFSLYLIVADQDTLAYICIRMI